MAGSGGNAGEPQRHRKAGRRRIDRRRQQPVLDDFEPAPLQPLREMLGRDAEPPMGGGLAQEFELMGREIDHRQAAVRPEHAGGLDERTLGVVEIMQHLMDRDEIGKAGGVGQGVEVALTDLDMAQPAGLDIGAGNAEHLAALVDADGLAGQRREELEHAPGAGAEVEQEVDLVGADEGGKGGLDLGLGDMQGADLVPMAGDPAEIGLGSALAGLDNACQALGITLQELVLGRQQVDDEACDGRSGAGLGEAEQHPAPLLVAIDQAGLAHQLEVAADPGLALGENRCQLGDVEFAMREDEQEPEPGAFGTGAQTFQQILHERFPPSRDGCLHKHIFM
jgi:hypothetical protein